MQGSGDNQGGHPARWFVRVDDAVYGPFDDHTLAGYFDEGRVTAQSFLSQSANGLFRQVATIPAMMQWLDAQRTPVTAKPQAAPLRVCLVMAEIRSGRSMAFLQALQALGDVQRLGDTLWIVGTHASPEDAIAVLSPPLAPEDRLFVVDASDADRASFNLGQSVDARMKALFEAAIPSRSA